MVPWASRIPCATWSWLQKTKERHVNQYFDLVRHATVPFGGYFTHSASSGTTPATMAAPILSTAAPASAISSCAWMVPSITACCGGRSIAVAWASVVLRAFPALVSPSTTCWRAISRADWRPTREGKASAEQGSVSATRVEKRIVDGWLIGRKECGGEGETKGSGYACGLEDIGAV